MWTVREPGGEIMLTGTGATKEWLRDFKNCMCEMRNVEYHLAKKETLRLCKVKF